MLTRAARLTHVTFDRRRWVILALALAAALTAIPSISPGPVGSRRIVFIVDSWYRWSHADVIGRRFLDGYRMGDRSYPAPLTIASVFRDAAVPDDLAPELASRYGFRIATSITDALLEPQSRSRLAADGVLIATREDIPGTRQRQSPVRRVEVMRDILRIMDQTGTHVPVFIDKMLAATWEDSQAIVGDAARRGVPLMAGSVLPFTPLDQPLRTSGVTVGVVIASTPLWAFGFHAAELLQGFMEQRAGRETGVAEIRDVGAAYLSMPNRDAWGGRVFDALWAAARTRRSRAPSTPILYPQSVVLLIQYTDGARGVLALTSEFIDDSEFLLGAQYADGTVATSGLILRGQPYDHFGYLVYALSDFFTTRRPSVPVERTLLTTGVVLFGQQARQGGALVPRPPVSYTPARGRR